MNMKNKKTIALISGAVGICMLTTAAVASYQTANGYDALKKSILSTIDYKNCTISAVMAMELDGEEKMRSELLHELALENGISHTSATTSVGDEPYRSDNYYYGNSRYNLTSSDSNEYDRYSYSRSRPNLWDIEPEDRDTANKALRFVELASDTVIGDLRSNFVCTDDSDDSVSYSIALDSVQIPEVVNAGLSMVFSMSNSASYYAENPEEVPEDSSYYYTALLGNDTVLDSLTMDYTINKDGSFRDGTMSAVFTGNGHTMTFNISCGISNVGDTSIATLEEQGAVINDRDYEDAEIIYND